MSNVRTTTVTLGSTFFTVPCDLASLAFLGEHQDQEGRAHRRLAQALSEGLMGEAAVLRAAALTEVALEAERVRYGAERVAEMQREAARLDVEAAKAALEAARLKKGSS